MTDSSYTDWSTKVFGKPLSTSIFNFKLHSSYPADSIWFQRAYEALLGVEKECVFDLIAKLKDQAAVGEFVEFGIFEGAWVNFLYEATEKVGLNRQIWGFDSFEGLSDPHPEFDSTFWKKGMYAASLEQVRKNVRAGERKRIRLVKGFFEESLKRPEAQVLSSIAFARIDCDIYEPSVDCLNYLSNRLSDGAILVFDDWTHSTSIGEGRAFAEWVPKVPHLKFEVLFQGPWDHLYLRVSHV